MRKLQSLDAWQISVAVSRLAYRVTLKPRLAGHHRLIDQIRGAAISIPANLAEGYALGTTAQMYRCSRLALGSAAELWCHLDLANDMGLLEGEQHPVVSEAERLVKVLIGLCRGLGRKLARRKA